MAHATVINNGLQISATAAALMGCITVLIFWKLENNRMKAGNISREVSSAGNTNNPSLAISLRTE